MSRRLGRLWEAWVPQYLERHCQTARTYERYKGNWVWLAHWLQENRYDTPKAITYRNALSYIDWRIAYKKKSGNTVSRNTAIMELKFLAMIIGEAVPHGLLPLQTMPASAVLRSAQLHQQ